MLVVFTTRELICLCIIFHTLLLGIEVQHFVCDEGGVLDEFTVTG